MARVRAKPREFEAWNLGSGEKPDFVRSIIEVPYEEGLYVVKCAIDRFQTWTVYAEMGDWIVLDPELSDIALSPTQFNELFEVIDDE